MAGRSDRPSERKDQPDQRRTPDRRAAARPGASRGRRATDAPSDARSGGADRPGGARKRRSTSDGREPLVVYLRPESIKALKIAALEQDTTVSAILADQADAWLRAQGRSPRR